ncbi:MAG: redox-sensing transcriptional repressor Rex [Ilumatobacteraceae bacterium]
MTDGRGFPHGGTAPRGATRARRIPEATVARLPVYLRILVELAQEELEHVSSERLADLAGVNAAKVRKDLSYLGSYGTRGVGYEVSYLVYQIRRELGLTHDWPVVIVGAGNLGQALAGYGGFGDRGFPVAAVVDIDQLKVGTVIGGTRVRQLDELSQVVRAKQISIGVIATPPASAQDAADRLVRAGVTSILNFAPVVLSVPPHIRVRKVDLALELQILSYYEQRDTADPGLSIVPGPSGSVSA